MTLICRTPIGFTGSGVGAVLGVLLSSLPIPITTGIDGPTVPLDTMVAASLGISELVVTCGIIILCGIIGFFVEYYVRYKLAKSMLEEQKNSKLTEPQQTSDPQS